MIAQSKDTQNSWYQVSYYYRLVTNGTGTLTVDTVNFAGVVTLGAVTITALNDVGVVNAFLSEDIKSIAITFPPTVTVDIQN